MNDSTGVLHFIESEYYDLDVIKDILTGDTDPNLRTDFEMTALHVCSLHSGSKEPDSGSQKKENGTSKTMHLIKILLELGTDINAQAVHGRTPLMWFISYGFPVDVIKMLLDNGADPNITDKWGTSALHYCVLHNNSNISNIFEYLISGLNLYDSLSETLNCTNSSENHDAAMIVEVLINYGAEIDLRDSRQSTPLLLFLKFTDCSALIRILLQNGADLNIVDSQEVNVVHDVCSLGTENQLELLLNHGANVQSTDTLKRTVLMNAVRYCFSYKIIKLILSKGADPNSKDENLKTALHYCSEYDDAHSGINVIRVLLESGADVNATDFRNVTPLMEFVEVNGNENMIQFLLENGADPNIANSYGTNALHISCDLMTKRSVDWFESNSSGRCALKRIITILVNHGVNLFAKDVNENLAIHMLVPDSDKPVAGFEPDDVAAYLLRCMVFEKDRDVQHFYRKRAHFESIMVSKFIAYINSLVQEVERMEIHMVKEKVNLRDFCRISNKRRLGLYYKNSTLMYTNPEELALSFPLYYHDKIGPLLLMGKIWADIWNKIDRICISIRKDGKEVVLSSECIRTISYYLNEKELCNIFIASLAK